MRLISDEKAKDMIKNHRSDFTTEYDYRTARACINAVPSAQPDTIPLEWIQRYADDWEDMSYAYDNPILGMLEDWRDEQNERKK